MDRKTAIEWIEQVKHRIRGGDEDFDRQRKEALDMAIVDMKICDANNAGWISVKDRLPDSNRFVLVCNDDGHMMIAQYIEETAQWQYKYINYDVDIWDDEEQGPVCYWAYLPEPPKEG